MSIEDPIQYKQLDQPGLFSVLQGLDQAIALQNEAGQYVFANQAFLALLSGFTTDNVDIAGCTNIDLFDAAAADEMTAATKSVWSRHSPIRWTQSIRRASAIGVGMLPNERLLRLHAFLTVGGENSCGLLCLVGSSLNTHADTQFLALLSHEFRSPLNAMVGWLQVMQSPKTTASTTTRALSGLDDAVQRQRRLAEQLLNASQIFSGQIRLDLTTEPIAPLLARLVDEHSPAALDKGITLELPEGDSSLAIRVDRTRFAESLSHVLESVILRTRKGHGISVSTRLMDQQIEIEIADANALEAWAEPAPLSATNGRQSYGAHGGYPGPGIGLAIAKALVELQGGLLTWAFSGAGNAASARLSFPRAISLANAP